MQGGPCKVAFCICFLPANLCRRNTQLPKQAANLATARTISTNRRVRRHAKCSNPLAGRITATCHPLQAFSSANNPVKLPQLKLGTQAVQASSKQASTCWAGGLCDQEEHRRRYPMKPLRPQPTQTQMCSKLVNSNTQSPQQKHPNKHPYNQHNQPLSPR
jgi:hypothetical protein